MSQEQAQQNTIEIDVSDNDALSALADGMKVAKKAAKQYVNRYGTTPKELALLIESNRADWSGGVLNPTNIYQMLVRDAATTALTVMVRNLNSITKCS